MIDNIPSQSNCNNNIVEYETYTHGLKAVAEMKIKKLNVYRDSMLIIYQVKGEWQTKDEKLKAISGIPFQTSKGLWWDIICTFRKE